MAEFDDLDTTYLPKLNNAAPPPQANKGWFGPGLAAGYQETRGSLDAAAAMLGRATGLDGLQQWGEEGAKQRFAAAQAAGNQDYEKDPWSVGGIAYHVTKAIPQLAGMLATGAGIAALAPEAGAVGAAATGFNALSRVGAMAPRILGGAGLAGDAATAAAGRAWASNMLGATVAGYPVMAGGMYQQAVNSGQDTQGNAIKAMALGVPAAAIGGVMPAQLRDLAANGMAGGAIKRMLSGALEAGPTNMVQAGIQTALSQQFEDPNKSLVDKMGEIVQSSLLGGVVGGVFGGAAAGIGGKHAPTQEPAPEQAAATQPTTVPEAPQNLLTYQPQMPSPERAARPLANAPLTDLVQQHQELLAKGAMTPQDQFQLKRIQDEMSARMAETPPQAEPDLGPQPFQQARQAAADGTFPLIQDGFSTEPPDFRARFQDQAAALPDESFTPPPRPTSPAETAQPFQQSRWDKTNGVYPLIQDKFSVEPPDFRARFQEQTQQAGGDVAPTPEQLTQAEIANRPQPLSADATATAVKAIDKLREGSVSLTGQYARQLTRLGIEPATALAEVGKPSYTDLAPAQKALFDQIHPLTANGKEQANAQERGPAPVDAVEPAGPIAAAGASDAQRVETAGARPAELQTTADLQGGVQAPEKAPVAPDQPVGAPPKAANDQPIATRAVNDEVVQRDPHETMQEQVDAEQETQHLLGSRQLADETARTASATDDSTLKSYLDAGYPGQTWGAVNAWADRQPPALKLSEPAQGKLLEQMKFAESQLVPGGKFSDEAWLAGKKQDRAKIEQARKQYDMLREKFGLKPTGDGFTSPGWGWRLLGSAEHPAYAKPMAADVAKLLKLHDAKPTDTLTPISREEAAARVAQDATPPTDLVPKFSAPGDRAPSQIASDLQMVGMRGGDASHALDYLSKNAERPDLRELADLLNKRGVTSKLESSVPTDAQLPGYAQEAIDRGLTNVAGYAPHSDTIYLGHSDNPSVDFLHEAVHAATLPALAKDSQNSRQMQKLFDRTVGKLSDANKTDPALWNGWQNKEEFTSEALTNDRTQAYLKAQDPSAWQAFKNTVFKLLGMPERMRSTFDEVVDVSKKLMAETAQLKLTDGRDPIPGYEPRVGSIPDALAITPKFTSLADASKAYVQNAFDKVKNDPVATWDKISKFGTGWMDAQEVKLRSDHWLNGNASKWEQARELGNNVTNRLGQMVKPWRATEHAFAQANPQEHATLNNLRADANQQGYDFRKWSRDQDPLVMKSIADLAPEKAAALNARIDQAKQLWNNIAGVAKPTDDLYRANAQAAHFVKLNLVADAVYRNKYADRNLPAFALDPVQEIAQHAEMIEDAGAVAAYGRKTLNDRLTQLEKLGAAHAPDVEAMRLRETDLVNKIKDLMTSGADKDAISAARDEALKTHDEVQSLVGEQRDITQFVKSQRDAIAQADAVPYSHFGRDGEHFVGMKLATNPDGSLNPKAADRLKSLLVEAGHDNLVIDRDNENNEFFARVADATQRDSLARIAKTLSNEKLLADDVKNDKGVVTEPAFRQGEADGVNAQQFRGSAPAAVEKLLSRLSADHADLPDDVHKDLMGKLRGVYLDMLPKNSMVRLFEPRQGIMGYHQDMTASFDQYMSQFANAAGRMWSQPHILDALSGMRKSVDGLQTDLNAPKGAVDVATAFAREIMQRETGSPARARNGLMRNALAVNHMYYLGLSLSYMTELLTQIPTLLLPQLGRKFGYMPSAVAIANAVIPAAKVVRALMASGHGADGMLTPEALRNARLSDEHVKVATQTANRDKLELGGWTHATLSDAPSLAKSRMVQRMNALTVASEVFPRAMAMFAAHDLHSSEGGAAKARMGLNDYIDETIGQSMYNWQTDLQARHLGAGGFAGQITPLVTKFMSFQTKMINRLVREVNSAYGPLSRQQAEHDAARIPGADVDKLTKQYQSESRKFLAGHLAAVTTLSGTLGLPVAGVAASAASTLANFLGGTDKYDAETWYREHLNNVFGPQIGEAIAKGLPRLAGMDLSEHAGEDRLLPFSDMLTDKRKWSDVFSSAAWHSLGSPFSMAANMVKGATDVANGRMLKGVQEVLPSSAKNVFSAWRMSQYGYEDNRGVKLPMQAPGAGDILMQAVGITPQPLAHEREATEALQGLKDRRSIVTSNLSANLVTAMSHHDNDAMQAALRSYQAFDADHPGAFADPTKDISKAYAEQNRGKAFGVLDLNPRDLDQMRTIRAYGMLRSP